MTDRKAIKMLKGFLLITSIAEIEDEEEKEEIEETFQTAISALEEREERRKGMTNSDHIRSMTDDELAAYFMIFRPSDACFDDDEKNYISLNSRYFKHSQDCFVENLNWLQQLYTEDE